MLARGADESGPSGAKKIVDIGTIFYETFGSIDQVRLPGPGKAPQIPLSSTLFALSSVLLESPGFVGRRYIVSELAPLVRDGMFRGESRHVNDCLAAMVKLGYATDVSQKIDSNMRRAYEFTEKYSEKLKEYTISLAESVIGRRGESVNSNWVKIAREIFDFLRFKYTPVWYLLGRKITRHKTLMTSAAPPDILDQIDENQKEVKMFTSPDLWSAINKYLICRYENQGQVSSASLIASLTRNGDMKEAKAVTLIREMISLGFCERAQGGLILNHAVDQAVGEYELRLDTDYAALERSIRLIVGDGL